MLLYYFINIEYIYDEKYWSIEKITNKLTRIGYDKIASLVFGRSK